MIARIAAIARCFLIVVKVRTRRALSGTHVGTALRGRLKSSSHKFPRGHGEPPLYDALIDVDSVLSEFKDQQWRPVTRFDRFTRFL